MSKLDLKLAIPKREGGSRDVSPRTSIESNSSARSNSSGTSSPTSKRKTRSPRGLTGILSGIKDSLLDRDKEKEKEGSNTSSPRSPVTTPRSRLSVNIQPGSPRHRRSLRSALSTGHFEMEANSGSSSPRGGRRDAEQMFELKLLASASWSSSDIARSHPPLFSATCKKFLYDLACPKGCNHYGTVYFSRYSPPQKVSWLISPMHHETLLTMRQDAYDYAIRDKEAVEWHVNFAHMLLFVAYPGQLFAQDEIQVAEHPILASVREVLKGSDTDGLTPVTRDCNRPTPCLIRNAERRISVDLAPNVAAGRPRGLYGNNLAHTSESAIKSAVTVLSPTSLSNIIAMEAPSGSHGAYSYGQIYEIFLTALTGFSAAKKESGVQRCIIHTGNWGTGAYGGNKVLMALLQIIAAHFALIDELVFHSFDKEGSEAFQQAKFCADGIKRLTAVNHSVVDVDPIIENILAYNFQWGVSNGT